MMSTLFFEFVNPNKEKSLYCFYFGIPRYILIRWGIRMFFSRKRKKKKVRDYIT